MTETRTCSIVTVERQPTAVVKAKVPFAKMPEVQRASDAKVAAALPSLAAGPVDRGVTLWRPPTDGVLDMEMGVIVARDFAGQGDVVPSFLPAGRAAHFLLVGPFERLPGAWQILFDWCAAKGLKPAGVNWQIYGALSEDTSKQETSLYALLA